MWKFFSTVFNSVRDEINLAIVLLMVVIVLMGVALFYTWKALAKANQRLWEQSGKMNNWIEVVTELGTNIKLLVDKLI